MISDAQLAQAAAELANAIYESSPDLDAFNHKFSPRFEKKMARLIRKTNHPVFYRVLRSAACFILAVLIGFGSVLAIHAEAREYVFGWVKEQYESFYRYFFDGEADSNESARYQPGWMPEGCVFVTSYEINGGETYFYTDEQNNLIHFTYTSDTNTTQLFLKGVEYNQESVLINGFPGDVYISTTYDETNGIVWTNTDENVLFFVSGNFTADELLKIAESIKIY